MERKHRLILFLLFSALVTKQFHVSERVLFSALSESMCYQAEIIRTMMQNNKL